MLFLFRHVSGSKDVSSKTTVMDVLLPLKLGIRLRSNERLEGCWKSKFCSSFIFEEILDSFGEWMMESILAFLEGIGQQELLVLLTSGT